MPVMTDPRKVLALQRVLLDGEEIIQTCLPPGSDPSDPTREHQLAGAHQAITSLLVLDTTERSREIAHHLGATAARALLAAQDPAAPAGERRLPESDLATVLSLFSAPLRAALDGPPSDHAAREDYLTRGRTLAARYLPSTHHQHPDGPEQRAAASLALCELVGCLLAYAANLPDAAPLNNTAPGLLGCCARDALAALSATQPAPWADHITVLIASYGCHLAPAAA
jgi:hypothetical protein